MKNLSVISALRAVAACAVMMFHFRQEKYGSPEWVRVLFDNGQLGVHMFFVISGFVIPLQLQRKDYSLRKFPDFFANRIVRIYPTFFVVTILAILVWSLQYRFLGGTGPDLSIANLAKNFTLSATALGGTFYINVAWTLVIEIFYYVVLGLLYVWAFRSPVWVQLLVMAGLLSAHYLVPGADDWNFFKWSPYFVAGFCMFQLKVRRHQMSMLLTLLCSLTMIFFDPGYCTGLAQLVAVALVCGLIWFEPDIRSRAVMHLGAISYSVYLIHNLLGAKLLTIVQRYFGDSALSYPIALTLAVGVSLMAAHLLFRFVELPSHRRSKLMWRDSP